MLKTDKKESTMKFNLSLKETHLEVIDNLKLKHPDTSIEKLVKKYVQSALNIEDYDLIFGTEREKCGGGCFSSEPQFELELEEEDYTKLKQIYDDYDFDKYETEEEEISKTIRCIINFIDDEPDKISI